MNGSGGNLAGCATCKGRCCREYRVDVMATDVRTLAAGTGLDPSDFIMLLPVQQQRPGFRMRPGGPAMDLVLIRNPATGACVFLMELGPDLARCGVYQHRPLVCRNFPTYFSKGSVDIRDDVKCGPDSWSLAAMDLTVYRKDLTRSVAAQAEHQRAVAAWNTMVDAEGTEKTPAELFTFLRNPVPEPA